ncbi:MAG TPA: FAD-dependent oxidoreductase, partial [Solirubrobacterales bacterium]
MLTRADAIEAIAGQRFEVVVIGGGITGAGVALDAASRGYSVALLERDDYAVGTSSRSSKMVHGGLRYLRNFDLGLVREALMERQLMVQLAPHLVYPTPFLVPTLGENRRSRSIGIGLNMYDVMATTRVGRSRREMRASKEEDEEYSWSPDRHRTIDGAEAAELVPALAPREPASAYLFYDCQTDDARLVLTILGEAERFGAVMLNGAEVTGLIDRDGHAAGVAFVEAASGQQMEVEAENVVNATGVWADRIRPEVADEEDMPRIAPSRGTHVIVDQ